MKLQVLGKNSLQRLQVIEAVLQNFVDEAAIDFDVLMDPGVSKTMQQLLLSFHFRVNPHRRRPC